MKVGFGFNSQVGLLFKLGHQNRKRWGEGMFTLHSVLFLASLNRFLILLL